MTFPETLLVRWGPSPHQFRNATVPEDQSPAEYAAYLAHRHQCVVGKLSNGEAVVYTYRRRTT